MIPPLFREGIYLGGNLPERYLGFRKPTPLKDIELNLLLEYFKKYLCENIVTFILNDETTIKINFIEDNFPHLIGLHKVSNLKKLKAGEINSAIVRGDLIFSDILKDKTGFSEIKDRIQHFPAIDSIIKNASIILDFDPLKVKPISKIQADFLVYSEEVKIVIYLAVRSVKDSEKLYDCYPISFIIDKYKRFESADFKKREVQRIIIDKK